MATEYCLDMEYTKYMDCRDMEPTDEMMESFLTVLMED